MLLLAPGRGNFRPMKLGKNAKDLTGRLFGRLTAVTAVDRERAYFHGRIVGVTIIWRCRCHCGKFVNVRSQALASGNTQSCGCLKDEVTAARFTKHGEAPLHGMRSTEYNTWKGMRERCSNPKHIGWKHYGGRGIRVCKRWRESFKAFLSDMGRKPTPRHSLDRINPNGNYTPRNCRWATPHEQRMNQRKK